ncbi:MAG: hypothetical protein RR413_07090 [Christensenellaceae bacterium]
MNWLRKFMMGRYGTDSLNFVLILVSLALSIVFSIVRLAIPFISLLAWIPLIFAVYRMFSKNIPKRQQEYYVFLKFTRGIKEWFVSKKKRFSDRKVYKYFKCTKCKQELRVPKGKGKISVTCPKCHEKFIKNT